MRKPHPSKLNPSQDAAEPVSKSQLKREASALQKLGKRITELNQERLANLDLPDRLRKAIEDYQRFTSREARRRQLQFIGKLMRDVDVAGIEAQFATWDGQSAESVYQFHQLEQWRERLIKEPEALTLFIEAYPNVDRQQLRVLIKKARQAPANDQSKAPARALFRFLRETHSQALTQL